MDISVGTRWNRTYADIMKELGVNELFGSMRIGPAGNGRASAVLPDVTFDEVRAHINYAHKIGMRFNYTYNTSCLGNQEYNSKGLQKIINEIDQIYELGVDQITVTIPFLIELIKKRHPDMKVKASVINQIQSVEGARHFIELGADALCIGNNSNRKFKVLKAIREMTDIKLELLANESCLMDCPYRNYHYNLASHASQQGDKYDQHFTDYCIMKCMKEKTTNPARILKSNFIRPEDVKIYEELGFDVLKISTRHLPDKWGIRCVKAYAERKYDGNLLDIICPVAMNIPKEGLNMMQSWSEEEWERFIYSMDYPVAQIKIDNRKLDGFLDHFMKEGQDCNSMCGVTCHYCENMAREAFVPDEDTERYQSYVDFLEDGIVQVMEPEVEAEKNVAWAEGVEEVYEDFLLIVPKVFRGIARKKTTQIAHQYARQKGTGRISMNEMIRAVYEQTPKSSKKKFYEKVKLHKEVEGIVKVLEQKGE